MGMTGNFLQLMRLRQWVKNAFVFLPLFFNGSFFDWKLLLISTVAFFAFCLASSAVYCVNDVMDAEEDRLHPVKRFRPVASGRISANGALSLAAVSFVCSLFLSGFLLSLECMGVVILYVLMNIAYTFRIKRLAIVDMFVIAFGFVLRLWIDGLACDIELSPWIVSTTFILMLFLAVAKRYDDVRLREDGIDVKRRSTANYTPEFLRQILGLLAAVTFVCYLLYTLSADVEERHGGRYLYTTSIFVLFGILRYLQITIVKNESGDPTEVVLKDKYIVGTLACWVILFTFLLYV